MSMRRRLGLATAILVLASPVGLAGSPLASPSAAAVSPAAGKPKPKPPTVAGQPPRNYVMPAGARFAFPNRSKAEKFTIRSSVLLTIQSTWGGLRDANRLPIEGNGSIRLATWSFNDMAVAKALVAAHKRGVSVQIIAAQSANADRRPWKYLKRQLGQRYFLPGVTGSSDRVSFARECRGSCRGRGGTPHSKFFLFDNVGSAHARNVVMQTSMNLTQFGYQGQWNFAQVVRSAEVYAGFLNVYREMRFNTPNAAPYRVYNVGAITSLFFPLPGASAVTDPVMEVLNQVKCTGSTTGAARTRIRIINYSIYDTRGTWIAKRLRKLWDQGCDIKFIYSLSTRPVMGILRSGAGRGAIPVKQSVILNSKKEIVKYNHSKYMTISGVYGTNTNAWLTLAGSSNWSNAGFSSDEQMQLITGYGTARAYMLNFDKTWAQKSSRAPGFFKVAEARMLPNGQPAFGQGALKYMNPYGD